MKKLIKYSIITIVSFVVIILAGIIILTTIVNPNEYKPLIIKTVLETTGRTLNLNGNIGWTFFPHFGLKVENASLSNPADFKPGNFITIKSFAASLDLLPLLHKQININTIYIDGLNLDFMSQGNSSNWRFSDSNTSGKKSKLNQDQIKIDSIASALVTDKAKQTNSNLHLELDAIKITNSTISYTKNNEKPFKINTFNLSIDSGYTGDMMFDSKAQVAELKDVTIKLNDILKGAVNFKLDNFKQPNYKGDLDISQFSANGLFELMSMPAPQFPNKKFFGDMTIATNFTGDKNSMLLNPVKVSADDSHLTGKINITSFSPLKIIDNLNVDKINLADFADLYGYQIPVQKISANGSFNLGNSDFPKNLNLQQNLNAQNITLQGLDLNDIIVQLNKAFTNTASVTKGDTLLKQVYSKVSLKGSIDALNSIRSQLNIKGKKNLNKQSNLGNLTTNLAMHNGITNPAVFNLNGPNILSNGQGTINLNQKSINYTVNTKLNGPQTSSLLALLVFPYRVIGSLSAPKGSLDMTNITNQILHYYGKQGEQAARDTAKEATNQAIKKGIAPTKEKATQAIRNLFH